MASFFSFLTNKKFPSPKTIRQLLRGPFTALSALIYSIFFAICAVVFCMIIIINNRFLVTVPAHGGNLTEGVIGAPHFINPILATTTTDQRLVALVYGSLMKNEADGSTVTSLASQYSVSPDGLTYTITLLPNLRFDDNKPLTSDDVVFTVEKMQDSNISNTSDYWQNISVSNPDSNTIVFTLPAPDTSFLSHLNFGILPKHIWQQYSDDTSFENAPQNLRPVGAGPFAFSKLIETNGIPETVILKENKHFALDKPYLHTLTISSFANQLALFDALQSGTVDFSYDVTPDTIANNAFGGQLNLIGVPRSQTVNIYRSPTDKVLADPNVVNTINNLIDKNAIIATVQHGYGTPLGLSTTTTSNKKITISTFSLAVENDSTLLAVADNIAQQLQQYGIIVSVNAFDPGTFQQNVATGNFTILLAESDSPKIGNYSSIIPLYTELQPDVFTTNTHTTVPDPLTTPDSEYQNVEQWYSKTNKIWKWFIGKQATNNS